MWHWREIKSPSQDTKSIGQELPRAIVEEQTGEMMPFGEMTIPYLRTRTYHSRLGELTKYTSTSEFDTYLTSYDSDGLKINGLLTIPKGEPPEGGWRGIVFVHGYIAPSIYRTTEKYEDYVNYLARNGFAVFKIDLRGHGKSEGEAGGAYYSADYVIDTLNARAALATHDLVDPEAIGLWGHSMAGNVTFRAFVAAQNIPALVIWAGAGYSYEDLQKYGLSDNSYRPPAINTERRRKREEMRAMYGEFERTNSFWSQVAPTNYLEGVAGAVQLHHAVDDKVVNIGYSRDLKPTLDDFGIVNEIYEYQSGGHNLSGSAFTQAMKRTVEFFHAQLEN